MDCSLPGSSVNGILQARILEWVAMPSSRDLLHPGIKPVSLTSPALSARFFIASATWETHVSRKREANLICINTSNICYRREGAKSWKFPLAGEI